jgi:transposase
MRFVATKTTDQLDLQALHRVRERWVGQRTGIINQTRLPVGARHQLSSEIAAPACQDKGCERLMTVPGVGPIISSAMVAAIGTGDAFEKGRDFGAWLGLALLIHSK